VGRASNKYRKLQKATQSYEMITTRTKTHPKHRHRSSTYVSNGAKNKIWAYGSTQSLLIYINSYILEGLSIKTVVAVVAVLVVVWVAVVAVVTVVVVVVIVVHR
jgi:hypothetical protein